MLSRREFMGACGTLAAAGSFGLGCGGVVYELAVDPRDHGRSVYQATARFYEVRVDRRPWENPRLAGLRKIVSIDGFRSENWVFEVDGARYDGSADAAELTRVAAGEIITWREV